MFERLALVRAGTAVGCILKLPNGEGIELTVRAAALELPPEQPAFELVALVWAGAADGRTLKLPNRKGIELTVTRRRTGTANP